MVKKCKIYRNKGSQGSPHPQGILPKNLPRGPGFGSFSRFARGLPGGMVTLGTD